MATLLDDAIPALRGLPEDVQAAAARAVLACSAAYADLPDARQLDVIE